MWEYGLMSAFHRWMPNIASNKHSGPDAEKGEEEFLSSDPEVNLSTTQIQSVVHEDSVSAQVKRRNLSTNFHSNLGQDF
jgi:hypothetical protein